MSNHKEHTRVVGKWRREVRDAKTMEVLEVVEQENVITSLGLALFAEAMTSNFRTNNNVRLCLGVGNGTPGVSDTDLFSPISTSRKSTSISRDGASYTYYARYMPEDANGYTFTEAGIFEKCSQDGTNGTLLNHLMLSPTLVKDSSKLVDFYITITFA